MIARRCARLASAGHGAAGDRRIARTAATREMHFERRDMADLDVTRADAVLIGGGIASATLAAMLSELEPGWDIEVLERLDSLGAESSDAWNNAGTGHSALCELNYTPQDVDGSVSPAKAISINEQFQVSRQFWAHLVENDRI